MREHIRFSSVTLSYFVHSTEDAARLKEVVCSGIGILPLEIATDPLEGYYGNVIIHAKAHLTGARADEVVEKIAENMAATTRKQLLLDLEKSMDEHEALYLRFDRQTLAGEQLSFSDDEPIRIKLKPKFRTGGHETMKEAYAEVLGLA